MPSSVSSSDSLRTLRRQVEALRHRVTWLERAIKAKRSRSKQVPAAAHLDREWAELDAQMTAMSDYGRREVLESYRGHPEQLEAALERERKRDRFFRERGVKPLGYLAGIARELAKDAKK